MLEFMTHEFLVTQIQIQKKRDRDPDPEKANHRPKFKKKSDNQISL